MRNYVVEALLIANGLLIVTLALTADLYLDGSPGFGFTQFVGMTVGMVSVFIGSRYLLFPDRFEWDRFFFLAYLICILTIGLWPGGSGEYAHKLLFNVNRFTPRDFVLNVVGLIPLGFLLMPVLRRNTFTNRTAIALAVVALSGFTTSLVIELSQYAWIPGRYSSAYDLLGNTTGAFIGALASVVVGKHRSPLPNI